MLNSLKLEDAVGHRLGEVLLDNLNRVAPVKLLQGMRARQEFLVALDLGIQRQDVQPGNVVQMDRGAGNGPGSRRAEQRAHEHVVGSLDDLLGGGDGLVASEDEEGEYVNHVKGRFPLGDELLGLVEGGGLGRSIGVEDVCEWAIGSGDP